MDADIPSALPTDGTSDDELDFDVIRALASNSSCVLCDGKDHRIATCPQLVQIEGNNLATRVCISAIGPSHNSFNGRPPRTDARPRQDARPHSDRRQQKVHSHRPVV